jgi:hypothetical protein
MDRGLGQGTEKWCHALRAASTFMNQPGLFPLYGDDSSISSPNASGAAKADNREKHQEI